MGELSTIQTEVDERVWEATADLLPMVMAGILARNSLNGCQRCDVLLIPYVKAQIELTRARRHYHHCDNGHCYLPRSVGGLQSGYCGRQDPIHRLTCAAVGRDAARREYRSTPCTCLVKKKEYNPSQRGVG